MIEMFIAVTILLLIIGVALLVIFAAPWWLTLFSIAVGILLLNKLVNPAPDAGYGVEDD